MRVIPAIGFVLHFSFFQAGIGGYAGLWIISLPVWGSIHASDRERMTAADLIWYPDWKGISYPADT